MTFPRYRTLDEAAVGEIEAAFGAHHIRTEQTAGEHAFHVARGGIVEVLRTLRDDFHYQQLMEIAGVDYPERGPERFEVVYNLLSLTKNHRLRVHVTADDVDPVPSVTGLWPVAGWLEREVFDMFGVLFDGNPDLRRILTDYGFRGHPFRKDFPMTGYVEMRYSEEAKRVVYEPVSLAQDYRPFDFMSPWEGAEYVLPGDEKAGGNPVQPGAQSPAAAKPAADAATAPPDAGKPAPAAARSVQGLGKPDEVKT